MDDGNCAAASDGLGSVGGLSGSPTRVGMSADGAAGAFATAAVVFSAGPVAEFGLQELHAAHKTKMINAQVKPINILISPLP
jgi:hypothetical protein